ncbi:UNVERIFIED_CONTAM: Polypyrimidine tract-binding protein2 [Sesamum radiatum]|uniref:Polypyrimidine tract-binding protein2 n=1 Tax=Sesamum radiatum TaxID=300843 RepID=A0AAW2KDX8_SESRA
MSSVSSQPQFRYTQPPSKVLHLRNLPWECTEEELIELGKPFGKVVNTKCNVGANRNQAFIEFAELNQAIAMISYYASSSEPAQVRGKTVYLQYSNRQEIVNNKTTADVAGNVLLVTIEGNDARLVSIDVLHLVFSAFGFVHKITTFEKTAGFQALVQFSDSETASAAKDALDGRSIPSYLIPELGPCSLRITYSAHTDLSVKFQSHRSRDYTNPLLPVAPSAIDASGQHSGIHVPPLQFNLGVDGKKLEPESNVLLASIENMQYAVTLDVLHTVFSAFGPVLKIAMFDKNGGLQALIQYPGSLEGHCIYDGGYCKLHISYSRHTDLSIKVNNDRSRDYTIPSIPAMSAQPSILGQQPYPMGGPGAHAYNGTQYAPVPDSRGVPPPSAGWNSAVPSIPQSMPMQMHNYPYGPPTVVLQWAMG